MKLELEGNKRMILKLRKELKKRLMNDGITTKEVLPESKPIEVEKKEIETKIEPERESEPKKVTKRRKQY